METKTVNIAISLKVEAEDVETLEAAIDDLYAEVAAQVEEPSKETCATYSEMRMHLWKEGES